MLSTKISIENPQPLCSSSISDGQSKIDDSPFTSAAVSNLDIDDNSPHNWTSFYDEKQSKFYYYNLITKKTQWEKPTGFKENKTHNDAINSIVSKDHNLFFHESKFEATFNKKSGVFASSTNDSYWDKVGRSSDRAGRQLSSYFDVSQLDKNREEATIKRRKLQLSNIDWTEFKREKKLEKEKKRNLWLLNDE